MTEQLNISFPTIFREEDFSKLTRMVTSIPQDTEIVLVKTVPTKDLAINRGIEKAEPFINLTGVELKCFTWNYYCSNFEDPWGDNTVNTFSFAGAKNVAKDQCNRDMIFTLDSDEKIANPEEVPWEKIANNVDNHDYMDTWMFVGYSNGEAAIQKLHRIYRNLPDIRYQYDIHETLRHYTKMPNEIKIAKSNILINHFGYAAASDEDIAEKRKRAKYLLQKQLQRTPEDPFILQKLAQTMDSINKAKMLN